MEKIENDILERLISLDNGGRRSGGDRRNYSYTLHIPERRSGQDRRSGEDRRRFPRAKAKLQTWLSGCPPICGNVLTLYAYPKKLPASFPLSEYSLQIKTIKSLHWSLLSISFTYGRYHIRLFFHPYGTFEHSGFEFVSHFDIRISNFITIAELPTHRWKLSGSSTRWRT